MDTNGNSTWIKQSTFLHSSPIVSVDASGQYLYRRQRFGGVSCSVQVSQGKGDSPPLPRAYDSQGKLLAETQFAPAAATVSLATARR